MLPCFAIWIFFLYVHLPHAFLLCISHISGSSSQAGYSRKKSRPNEEFESEEEEILPTARTARQQQLDKQKLPKGTAKKVVKTPVRKPQPRKPPPPITFDKMKSHLYREYRNLNPYSTPRILMCQTPSSTPRIKRGYTMTSI